MWLKDWAKRLQQLPTLVKQVWFWTLLKRGGAEIGKRSFFSDVHLISGHLNQLKVGDDSFVGRVKIALHDQVVIGSRVCINDGAILMTGSHDVKDPSWTMTKAPICVEDYAWIATNAMILPGVVIGKGAVVGAGAVVSKDVPAYRVVAGNPARLLTTQRSEELNYSPTEWLALLRAWYGNNEAK